MEKIKFKLFLIKDLKAMENFNQVRSRSLKVVWGQIDSYNLCIKL